MKVIANIPEDMLQELKDGCFGAKHNLYDLAGAIFNGIIIPDNATNGDVIKAMFPNGKVIETEDGDLGYEILIDNKYSFCSWFDGVWWNAKWEGVQEE